MSKEIISTPNAPAAIGPYSQAVKAGGFLYLSGQIPLDPQTMAVVPGCVACQTEQALKNMSAVLESQGLTTDDVVKTTVFLADMNDFAKINAIYAAAFGANKPARSCVEVSKLPKDGLFEIEAVAVKE